MACVSGGILLDTANTDIDSNYASPFGNIIALWAVLACPFITLPW